MSPQRYVASEEARPAGNEYVTGQSGCVTDNCVTPHLSFGTKSTYTEASCAVHTYLPYVVSIRPLSTTLLYSYRESPKPKIFGFCEGHSSILGVMEGLQHVNDPQD